jgi:sugar phosphate isomerase/epimerase
VKNLRAGWNKPSGYRFSSVWEEVNKMQNSKSLRIIDRVSYHAVYDKSILDALKYAHRNGFAGIQLAVEVPHLSFESLSEEELQKITSFVEATGTRISIHAPDEATSLFQYSKFLRQGVKEYFHALFDLAARVKAQIITIHTGVMLSFKTDTALVISVPAVDLPIFKDMVIKNLDTLLKMADNRFGICVENVALDAFTLSILQPYLDNQRLALCWDLAKSWDNPIVEQFYLKNLRHIKQVHLHDVRREKKSNRRSHLVIGTGEIDFLRYFNELSEVDVLDYCIEVRPREKAKESLEALRKLLRNR